MSPAPVSLSPFFIRVHVEDAVVDCLDGYRFVVDKLAGVIRDSWTEGETGVTIDPTRVAVVGYSAGAHLAFMTVRLSPRPQPLPFQRA